MSKKFSVLLVMLTIIFSLFGGLIAGRLFTRKISITEEDKQLEILTVGELNIVDESSKLRMKLGKGMVEGGYGLFLYDEKGLMRISIEPSGRRSRIVIIGNNVHSETFGNTFYVQDLDKGSAYFRVSDDGPEIGFRDKNGNTAAKMSTNKYGGNFTVYEKVNYFRLEEEDKIRASIGRNEYGNGAINLWDKNGHRIK